MREYDWTVGVSDDMVHVDSSWTPPLDWPEEETWALVFYRDGASSDEDPLDYAVDKWTPQESGELWGYHSGLELEREQIHTIIRMTEKQVEQIENVP